MQIFFNILDLTAINTGVIYKETIGINIKRCNFILSLDEELHINVISRTYPFSNLTLNTEDESTVSSKKCKKCQINQWQNKKKKKINN